MTRAGYEVEVVPPQVDESRISLSCAEELVVLLSELKGRSVLPLLANDGSVLSLPPILAADTVGVFGENILFKPHDGAQARKMLMGLSGNSHEVKTGYFVHYCGKTISGIVSTMVFMRAYSRAEVDDYLNSGEYVGKAGAYAIQGLGRALVDRIEGSFSNVVGLPLSAIRAALFELGAK